MNGRIKKGSRGIALPLVLMIVVILSMFVATLTNLVRMDTKWSVKHNRSVEAYHLAEAAVDRGLWKLRESIDVWDSVADGTLPDEYLGLVEFDDYDTGTYKVIISTVSNGSYRKILGIGRDASTNEVRAIEHIVQVSTIDSALLASALDVQGGVSVEWGPVKSVQSITLTGQAANRYYPRKYSVGSVDPRDTSSALPNDDGIEYWAYYPVPDPPGINFDKYIDEAIADGEYYAGNHSFQNVQVNRADPEKTYYVGGNAIIKNTYLKGTIIVRGDVSNTGNGKGNYFADIPEDASLEYQSPLPLAPKSAQDYWDDEYEGEIQYELTKVGVEGFLYIGGDWSGNGGVDINGVVIVDGSLAGLNGNVTIWYDPGIALDIELTELIITTVSWKETNDKW